MFEPDFPCPIPRMMTWELARTSTASPPWSWRRRTAAPSLCLVWWQLWVSRGRSTDDECFAKGSKLRLLSSGSSTSVGILPPSAQTSSGQKNSHSVEIPYCLRSVEPPSGWYPRSSRPPPEAIIGHLQSVVEGMPIYLYSCSWHACFVQPYDSTFCVVHNLI